MSDNSSRKLGRPPIPPEKRRTVAVKVYMSEAECEDLFVIARRRRQDISEYLRTLHLRERARWLEQAVSSLSVPVSK